MKKNVVKSFLLIAVCFIFSGSDLKAAFPEQKVITIEVHREFQNQAIYLNTLLSSLINDGQEIVGVEVEGRPYTSKTALTLWINNKVQNTEWMDKEESTPLKAKKGWIIGKNVHSLQIYISSLAFIDNVKVFLSLPK